MQPGSTDTSHLDYAEEPYVDSQLKLSSWWPHEPLASTTPHAGVCLTPHTPSYRQLEPEVQRGQNTPLPSCRSTDASTTASVSIVPQRPAALACWTPYSHQTPRNHSERGFRATGETPRTPVEVGSEVEHWRSSTKKVVRALSATAQRWAVRAMVVAWADQARRQAQQYHNGAARLQEAVRSAQAAEARAAAAQRQAQEAEARAQNAELRMKTLKFDFETAVYRAEARACEAEGREREANEQVALLTLQIQKSQSLGTDREEAQALLALSNAEMDDARRWRMEFLECASAFEELDMHACRREEELAVQASANRTLEMKVQELSEEFAARFAAADSAEHRLHRLADSRLVAEEQKNEILQAKVRLMESNAVVESNCCSLLVEGEAAALHAQKFVELRCEELATEVRDRDSWWQQEMHDFLSQHAEIDRTAQARTLAAIGAAVCRRTTSATLSAEVRLYFLMWHCASKACASERKHADDLANNRADADIQATAASKAAELNAWERAISIAADAECSMERAWRMQAAQNRCEELHTRDAACAELAAALDHTARSVALAQRSGDTCTAAQGLQLRMKYCTLDQLSGLTSGVSALRHTRLLELSFLLWWHEVVCCPLTERLSIAEQQLKAQAPPCVVTQGPSRLPPQLEAQSRAASGAQHLDMMSFTAPYVSGMPEVPSLTSNHVREKVESASRKLQTANLPLKRFFCEWRRLVAREAHCQASTMLKVVSAQVHHFADLATEAVVLRMRASFSAWRKHTQSIRWAQGLAASRAAVVQRLRVASTWALFAAWRATCRVPSLLGHSPRQSPRCSSSRSLLAPPQHSPRLSGRSQLLSKDTVPRPASGLRRAMRRSEQALDLLQNAVRRCWAFEVWAETCLPMRSIGETKVARKLSMQHSTKMRHLLLTWQWHTRWKQFAAYTCSRSLRKCQTNNLRLALRMWYARANYFTVITAGVGNKFGRGATDEIEESQIGLPILPCKQIITEKTSLMLRVFLHAWRLQVWRTAIERLQYLLQHGTLSAAPRLAVATRLPLFFQAVLHRTHDKAARLATWRAWRQWTTGKKTLRHAVVLIRHPRPHLARFALHFWKSGLCKRRLWSVTTSVLVRQQSKQTTIQVAAIFAAWQHYARLASIRI